jgi:hypothetical protein
MRQEDLSIDTTFDPCWFSLDYTFKYSSFSALQELHFRCPPSNRTAGEAESQQIKCYTPVVYFMTDTAASSLSTPTASC